MNRKLVRISALFSVLALVIAAAAFAAATVTVKTGSTGALGKVVVSAKGLTLYHINTETGKAITCSGSCAATWPPLLVGKTTKLKAGAGIKAAKLGKLKRGSKFQVTYYGKRLYLYSGDSKAGNTNGEGLGGIWFAIKASGAQA